MSKSNRQVIRAIANRKDEFYTNYEDIERELSYYPDQFKDKVVYCNCDEPTSNFVKFFSDHFSEFRLKKLIATCYQHKHTNRKAMAVIYERSPRGVRMHQHALRGNGDFRSKECLAYLAESDIVCTNPPFSLFIDFFGQLYYHKKNFLIIGHKLAYSCVNICLAFLDEWCWFGVTEPKNFTIPKNYFGDGKDKRSVTACWYTNLVHGVEPPILELTEKYDPEKYPRLESHVNAIYVKGLRSIPYGWKGVADQSSQ